MKGKLNRYDQVGKIINGYFNSPALAAWGSSYPDTQKIKGDKVITQIKRKAVSSFPGT